MMRCAGLGLAVTVLLAGLVLAAGCATTPVADKKAVAPKAGLILAENGEAKAAIVVGANAPPSTRYAAEELQRFLKEITGASFDLITDAEPVRSAEIIVGGNDRMYDLNLSVDFQRLGAEGYVLLTKGKHLVIAGGEPRGTLYGVYGLLEDHLGCRWFTPAVSTIPKAATLTVEYLDELRIPALEYREPFVMDCFDGDWCARNRMNSSTGRLEPKHGGKVNYFGFVHTFDQLVPPATHFDTHPEYFALVDGKRVKDRTQLCCTNDDVVRLVIEEVRKRMREHPEATVFSVSQNDWANYCTCDKCAALSAAEGSEMGPMLYLVNSVARAVRDEFPDKLIDTLAYQYTRKPPKTMVPEPNVIIRLCSIECDFSHPFEERATKDNKTFCDDLEQWAQVSRRLWVWNYNTSFSHYLAPFPNLRVRGPNIRYMIKNNVRGIFEQDVYTTMNGEFNGLSGYLGAKLLWNPQYDEDRAINEFLEGVYGKAAMPIRLYLDLIHDAVKDPKTNMGIWIGPDFRAFTPEMLARGGELFDAAEKAVADEPETLERVRAARLSLDYTQIEHLRTHASDAYEFDHKKFTVRMKPEFAKLVNSFFEVAGRNNVTQIRENEGAMSKYKDLVMMSFKADGGTFPVQNAQGGAGIKPGLKYAYYEKTLDKLPNFTALTADKKGVAERVSLEPLLKKDGGALHFEGFVHAPADGLYSFGLRSNDGSRMVLDGKVLIDNDGLHKAETATQFIALRKGWHAVSIGYFQAGGDLELSLTWSGPGIKHQKVPAEAFGYRP
jgi:hypothetical protein